MDSPLLFPVRLAKEAIYVLDETLLPFRQEYIEVKDIEKALWVLGQMKTRALGQVLLFFYSCILFRDEFAIDEIVHRFSQRRPTFDFALLGDILSEGVARGVALQRVVEGFLEAFDAARRRRTARLASLLPNPAKIVTICNMNGELIYLYEHLQALGKKGVFFVCETRPYLQGTRLTFWELRRNHIPCRLICDNQAARLMFEAQANCVVCGADRATVKGDIINKVGTYSLARLAKLFNIPFYPLTQYPRDIDIATIEIEERPGREVFMYLEGDYSRIEALYPAFDVTPAELVSECIGLEISHEVKRD